MPPTARRIVEQWMDEVHVPHRRQIAARETSPVAPAIPE